MKNKQKKKPRARNSSKLNSFAFSALAGIVTYFVLFLISAFICYKSDIPKDKYYIIMIVITVISSLVSGYRLTAVNKEKGLINGMLGSAPIVLMTFIIAIMFNNGIPAYITAIPCVLSLISGAVAGAVTINLRR